VGTVPKTVTLVIPCYNEARRLDVEAFAGLVRSRAGLGLIFVDDGSEDGTVEVLERVRSSAGKRVEIIRQPRNLGKAEAVRRGLRVALEEGAEVVGFADADLATPPAELLRLMENMDAAPVPVLLGSRVRLLGRRIDRRPSRHYLGRIFATAASLALGVPVYDTQCGAKLFLRSAALSRALDRPFSSRWVFDVELLSRLLTASGEVGALTAKDMREVPLCVWRDVGGSSLRVRGMVAAGLQVLAFVARSFVRRLGRRNGSR